jgi:2-polyprenyl-3-methyl-5-hydroxy-6-metoxy-1,4-benzoquinol methylase
MTAIDRTATFFDRYARDFSAIYGNKHNLINSVVNPLLRRSMKVRYQMTLEGCEPVSGRSVLDIGCGPGHYSVELARRGASRVLGLDFADGMLDIARQSAARTGVQSVCTFERGNFFERPFDETFDYVIAMGFMDYVEEPVTMVKKALSLAKRRAFFSFPLDGGFLAWQRKVRYKRRCDLFMYTEDSVRRLMAQAGASRIDVTPIHRDLFATVTLD